MLLAGASCSSLYYNSSILGHDSIEFPIPSKNVQANQKSLGFILKAAPTVSLFTQDSTSSLQLGPLYSLSLPITDNYRYFFGFGLTGYLADTTVYPSYYDSNNTYVENKKNLLSYGFTAEFKPGILVDEDQSSHFFGLDFIFGKDFGDYFQFRKSLKSYSSQTDNSFSTGLNNYNMSPDGSTLSFLASYLNRTDIDKKTSYDFGISVGLGFSNWPADSYHTSLAKLTYMLDLTDYWWWVDFEDMNFLNVGVGIGFGYFLF